METSANSSGDSSPSSKLVRKPRSKEIPTLEELEPILLDTGQKVDDEIFRSDDKIRSLAHEETMTPKNNQSTTKSNFEKGESSKPPSTSTHDIVPEPVPMPSIDRPSEEARWSIPKVPHRLCEVKPIAYEPNAISIGPYHYGKDHLRAMDDVKQICFADIKENTGIEFGEFAESMEKLKERALKCYERPLYADLKLDGKFIEMMVIDGCFIVQLIRDMRPPELDYLAPHKMTDIWHDLLLLENQLPFFVLLELDRMITQKVEENIDEFGIAALSSFSKLNTYSMLIFPGSETCLPPPKDIKHLSDMVHKCCHPSPEGIVQHNEYSTTKKAKETTRSWKFIRSASELDNAGINFVGEEGKSLLDLTFTKDTDIKGLKFLNKVLKIPTICVDNQTERMLRNFMAFEQFSKKGEPTYVSDYVMLMDNLINTGKDVQLLCTSGVIDNWLGDDEAVAQMFNKLRDSTYSKGDLYYAEIYDKVNKHCKGWWNKSKAKLTKDYFNSPWSIISFSAALVLLMATLLQTVYALLAYSKSDNGGMHPPPPPPS